MGPGDVCRVPIAAVRHGRARQTLESGLCWDWGKVLWVPGQSGQYSGKIRFIEKPGVQDESDRHISDPREAYPEFRLRGPSANSLYCYPLCPTWRWYPGKIRFIEHQGKMGT